MALLVILGSVFMLFLHIESNLNVDEISIIGMTYVSKMSNTANSATV